MIPRHNGFVTPDRNDGLNAYPSWKTGLLLIISFPIISHLIWLSIPINPAATNGRVWWLAVLGVLMAVTFIGLFTVTSKKENNFLARIVPSAAVCLGLLGVVQVLIIMTVPISVYSLLYLSIWGLMATLIYGLNSQSFSYFTIRSQLTGVAGMLISGLVLYGQIYGYISTFVNASIVVLLLGAAFTIAVAEATKPELQRRVGYHASWPVNLLIVGYVAIIAYFNITINFREEEAQFTMHRLHFGSAAVVLLAVAVQWHRDRKPK